MSPRHMYISQIRTARRDRLADVDIDDLDLLTVAEVRGKCEIESTGTRVLLFILLGKRV